MPHPRQVDVQDLGVITIEDISFGMSTDIRKRIEGLSMEKRADEFANLVIKAMVQDPVLTTKDISKLSPIALASLCEYAAEVLAAKNEYDSLSEIEDVKKRVYEADLLKWKKLGERLAKSFSISSSEMMAPLLASIKTAIVDPSMASIAKIAADLIQPYQDTIGKMAAITTRIVAPHNYADVMSSSSEALANALKSLGPTKTFEAIVSKVAKSLPPEPFLSSAMVVSGLNSPTVHSFTYPVRHRPLPSVDEFEIATQESEQSRKLDAFDTLSSLEQLLRDQIRENMRSAFGDSWWKNKVPKDVRDSCEQRKAEKEKPLGPTYHPIFYAYIGDYLKIIRRKDNWEKVFKSIFANPVELLACFIWVIRVRDPIMHSRPIDDDDHFMMVAGARWIRDRINRNLGSIEDKST